MTGNQVYILVAILGLAIIALLFFLFSRKSQKKLTPLAGLAFGLVMAGLFISENQVFGYSLIAVGIILSVIDAVTKGKR